MIVVFVQNTCDPASRRRLFLNEFQYVHAAFWQTLGNWREFPFFFWKPTDAREISM